MRPCGLLGARLAHSHSPLLHSLLGDYEYHLWELAPEDVGPFLARGDFHGLNVTLPYKQSVLPFCQTLTQAARAVGSVNTILRAPDGGLIGDNTDIAGFQWMLRRSGVDLRGQKVLLLGSGGAARAAAYVLRQASASVVTISRRGENHYGNLHRHGDAAAIVNATPVGMFPETDAAPLDLTQLPQCTAVLDLIYNPARTRLLREAKALGMAAVGGLSMLVGQGARAAELFTGEAIDEARWEAVLAQLASRTENLILIGMPGCGKSTLGRALAEQTGRPLRDTDEILAAQTGQSIPALFAQEGEAGFRRREAALLGEIGRQSGQIIATGGGCVTLPENEAALRQNGRLIFIERPLALLPCAGRPLSMGADLAQLYRERLPLYRRFADGSVENDGTIAEATQKILEEYNELFGLERAEPEPFGLA